MLLALNVNFKEKKLILAPLKSFLKILSFSFTYPNFIQISFHKMGIWPNKKADLILVLGFYEWREDRGAISAYFPTMGDQNKGSGA